MRVGPMNTPESRAVLAALPAALKSRPELIELNKKAIEAGMEVAALSRAEAK